jgi:hypothetical protein
MNNHRQAPIAIGLEDGWATQWQWWPHRQFTFLCLVAEVNANNSKVSAHDKPAEHQIVFMKHEAVGGRNDVQLSTVSLRVVEFVVHQ